MLIYENYSLVNRNTFRIDVNARLFIEYNDENELLELLNDSSVQKNKLFHIGGGSNILFTKDFDGVILHSQIKGFEIVNKTEEYTLLKVGASEIWDDVVKYCITHNLYGSENLSLIPGETGAAAVQNIGAYGVEIKDIINSIDVIEIKTSKKRTLSLVECGYAYRESVFKKELKDKYIITFVELKLSNKQRFTLDYGNLSEHFKAPEEITLQTLRDTIISIRESKLPDPKKIGNAGSFFMNPYISIDHYNKLKQVYKNLPHYPVSENLVKIPAAWLIEHCGWKGKYIGNAGVHDKQSLVLINRGNAKASEIIELSEQIIETVENAFKIRLIPEVIFV